MNGVDQLDEQILASLQAHGRLTMKALAEQVGLSSPAMIERVRRLEERGVIAGYRAVIQPAALGRPVSALITVTVDRRSADDFLSRIEQESAVSECHRITGDASYLVKVHVADMAALEALIDGFTSTGALCSTSLILSSPVLYRPITPPDGVTVPRSRASRRRRRAAVAVEFDAAGEEGAESKPARPRGRPRTRIEAAES
jgi:Lrp/AsnC family transcriptional regulator, leucine-responsive regulatory protein